MRQVLYSRYPVINNRYHVVETLGSGGMASVYLAHDEVLNRDVALKVLSHRFVDDEEFVERFRREARISAALSHPNIASVHDLGETENGSYYMAMEYVPGGTLGERIREKGSLPPSMAVAIALQVAQALKAAHAWGTIHRDVKPQNILLTEAGAVKVVDFGIARAAAFSEITREGHVLGTAHYMSPEHAEGKPVSPQSDLYSLGVVLYEMLTGKVPYEADTGDSTVAKPGRRHLRPPQKVNPAIPEKVSAITVRLLSEDPEQRYPDAASLIADLKRVKRECPGNATTKVLIPAFQHVVQATRKTRITKPYTPPAPTARPGGSRRKPTEKQRRKMLPRVVLAGLILASALAVPNLVSDARSWLLGEIQRKIGNGLAGSTATSNLNQAPKTPSDSPNKQGGSFFSAPHNLPSQSPPDSRNGSGSYSLPGTLNPYPKGPSNPYRSPRKNSYREWSEEVEKKIHENLKLDFGHSVNYGG